MKLNSDEQHRRSIRLQGYDYAQSGAYFVTVVTTGRQCLFGEILNDEMQLNRFGKIVWTEWERTAKIRREVELGAFVVMPNHFHGIVILSSSAPDGADDVGATGRSPLPARGPSPKSLGALIGGFKSTVTKQINLLRNTPGIPLWQRNYYEYIIRNEKDWDRIHQYIGLNPGRWAEDEENILNSQGNGAVLLGHARRPIQ